MQFTKAYDYALVEYEHMILYRLNAVAFFFLVPISSTTVLHNKTIGYMFAASVGFAAIVLLYYSVEF